MATLAKFRQIWSNWLPRFRIPATEKEMDWTEQKMLAQKMKRIAKIHILLTSLSSISYHFFWFDISRCFKFCQNNFTKKQVQLSSSSCKQTRKKEKKHFPIDLFFKIFRNNLGSKRRLDHWKVLNSKRWGGN